MLNKWIGIGRLTKEVDLRYTPNGNATCSFTLACDRQMKDAQGNKQVDFISVFVPPYRSKLAELCSNYLSKGKLAAVEGEQQTKSYDKDGRKVYITEICADTVKFLSPKDSTDSTQADPYQEVSFNDPPF